MQKGYISENCIISWYYMNYKHFKNLNVSSFPARSERYHHLETEEDDTNDEDFNVELRQFSSCSHRFSKVHPLSRKVTQMNRQCPHLSLFSWEIKHWIRSFHMEIYVPLSALFTLLNVELGFAYIFHLQILFFFLGMLYSHTCWEAL